MTTDDIKVDTELQEPTKEPQILEDLEERAQIDLNKISDDLECEKEAPINPRFGARKSDLIKSIEKLTKKYSHRALLRMRKAELETILGGLFEDKCEILGGKRPDQKLMIDTMIKIVHTCCGLVEFGTKRYHEYLGGYCLHNFVDNVKNPESDALLRDVLCDVYRENEELLISLMSKETKLMMVFVLAGVQSARKYHPKLENDQMGSNICGGRQQKFREKYDDEKSCPDSRNARQPSRYCDRSGQRKQSGNLGFFEVQEFAAQSGTVPRQRIDKDLLRKQRKKT